MGDAGTAHGGGGVAESAKLPGTAKPVPALGWREGAQAPPVSKGLVTCRTEGDGSRPVDADAEDLDGWLGRD